MLPGSTSAFILDSSTSSISSSSSVPLESLKNMNGKITAKLQQQYLGH